MARRNTSELAAGFVVVVVAAAFLGYAVASTGRGGGGSGYTLTARFNSVGGLTEGSDVRIGGVPVGRVTSERIDPKTYQAVVTFTVANDIQLPADSSAQITSSGLLGGEHLALEPGGDEKMIPPGGTVTITQGSVSLEDLLGKFIFNVGDLSSNVQKQLQYDQQKNGAPPK